MRILTAEAMAKVDRAAVDELGVPSMVLMENAALGLAEAVAVSFPDAETVAIYCGPGNNGGDGLALARHLAIRGYRVDCFLAFLGKETRGDAATQLTVCRNMGQGAVPLHEIAPDDDLGQALAAARGADLVVDALFGTGLGRPLEGQLAALVEGLNEIPVPKLAVDLPSGLNGSRPERFGPHLVADLTVTFGTLKPAQVLSPTDAAMGELVVADLGVPAELMDRDWGEPDGPLSLIVPDELAGHLAPRRADTHKGTYGHLLIAAGSVGAAGAVVLAARSAVRAGAGLVTAAVPEPIVQTVDGGSIESMSLPLPAGADGRIAGAAVEAVLAAAAARDALALGPGMGQTDPVAAALRRVALEAAVPLVLDADGINAFAGRAAALRERQAPTILTPHPGEAARLLGIETAAVVADRRAAVRRAAAESGAIVVLKGHQSLVATPEGAVHVNLTGNAGMATGGTGDVLTGLIGSLLAQGFEPLAAALLGVYLHGAAGDLVAAEKGLAGLAAMDLVEALPRAFEELRAG